MQQSETGSNDIWKLTDFRFAVTKVSSDLLNLINYPAAGFALSGIIVFPHFLHGIISPPGSKLYYYKPPGPEQKIIPALPPHVRPAFT